MEKNAYCDAVQLQYKNADPYLTDRRILFKNTAGEGK
jgi:hypothetical protein